MLYNGVSRRDLESVRSRIGQSLIRLHRSVERHRSQDERLESLFAAWQSQWSRRRDQIGRRLEVIESQLSGRATDEASPSLSVVGVPADADEMRSIVGY